MTFGKHHFTCAYRQRKPENRISEYGLTERPIPLPIETDSEFQRAFSASFDRLARRLVLKAMHELLCIDGHVIYPNLIKWILKMLLDIVEADQNKRE